ncbi:MAG: hypothetical protein O3C21_03340 [Verrucomicrobia bacterium]|nr:hypothetical protein [Verrucomicrobiota bacterium]
MRNLILSLRVLLTAVICGSLVSCSLFRPKKNDEDTWGDPNWKIGDDGGSGGSAERSTNTRTVSPELAAAPGAGERRLVGTSQDADYWPTTQELEAHGGDLSIEHYRERERKALHSSNEPLAPASSSNGSNEPEEMYPMAGPELPTPADGVDPLAGFWDEKEDHTDGTIQRADGLQEQENEQEDPFIAGSLSESDSELEPELSVESQGSESQSSETPPVLMPIPPSSTPARAGMISSNTPTLPKSTPELNAASTPKLEDSKVSDVVLLDAESPVTDAAFEGVSLLDSGAMPTTGRSSEASFLDRRKRLSLTDLGTNSDSGGPLTSPSIEDAAADDL